MRSRRLLGPGCTTLDAESLHRSVKRNALANGIIPFSTVEGFFIQHWPHIPTYSRRESTDSRLHGDSIHTFQSIYRNNRMVFVLISVRWLYNVSSMIPPIKEFILFRCQNRYADLLHNLRDHGIAKSLQLLPPIGCLVSR